MQTVYSRGYLLLCICTIFLAGNTDPLSGICSVQSKVTCHAYNGFDEEARRNIQNFMQQQAAKEQEQQRQQQVQSQKQPNQTQQSLEQQKKKPELANWQKVMDNGEYLRSAEMAEEANYNMIDGLMNNMPKKKDKNAPRRSVLKRLRKHQQKIASQGKGQPQQQKAVEEEMERKKK